MHYTILQNGSIVWVAETGKSNFTADWCRELVKRKFTATDIKSHVILVQHSDTNERMTNDDDLKYVRNLTQYYKIPDGNSSGNGTPGYRSYETLYMQKTLSPDNPNPRAREIFAAIKTGSEGGRNKRLDKGGLDYSDHVAVWWIMGEPNNIDNNGKFWDRYVTNRLGMD